MAVRELSVQDSPRAAPCVNVKGRRGVRLGLKVSYLDGRQQRPVVALRRAVTKDVL